MLAKYSAVAHQDTLSILQEQQNAVFHWKLNEATRTLVLGTHIWRISF